MKRLYKKRSTCRYLIIGRHIVNGLPETVRTAKSVKNDKNIYKCTYMMYEIINGAAVTGISIYGKVKKTYHIDKYENKRYMS